MFVHVEDDGEIRPTVAGRDFAYRHNLFNAESASGAYIYAENTIASYNRPELGADASATNLEDVLESIRWEAFDGEGDNLSVDLQGLTNGQQYKLTLLFSDSNSTNRTFDISINEIQAADDFSVGSLTGGDNTKGAWWTYEFTSGSNELNILLNGGSVPGFTNIDRNPVLSGLMLEAIPEPGSAMTASVALAALTLRRRRNC